MSFTLILAYIAIFVACAGIVYSFSRLKYRDGSIHHHFTLAVKLSGGFGLTILSFLFIVLLVLLIGLGALEQIDAFAVDQQDQLEQLEAAIEAGDGSASTLLEQMRSSTEEMQEAEVAGTHSALMLLALLSFALVAASVFSMWFLTNRTIKPIFDSSRAISSGIEDMRSSARDLAGSSTKLADGANEQASNFEQMASSLKQMASETSQNSDNAAEVLSMSQKTTDMAHSSLDSMNRMRQAISDIRIASNNTASILSTIDEIAFQTNLLALNAAVEAARAGEAGKGFAVVAEEVRNLAQRSAEASRNTNELITGSQQHAESGDRITGEIGKIIKDIDNNITAVTHAMEDIARASNQQQRGIDQINDALGNLNSITHDTASAADDTSRTSDGLESNAASMHAAANDLKAILIGQKK